MPGKNDGLFVSLFCAVALVVGCAKLGPPPGGPRDTVAPTVVSVSPESLAVGVPVDSPITITFSEKVDKNLELALWVAPGAAVKPKVKHSGESVTIQLAQEFPESTTVGVLLSTVVRDTRREGQQNHMLRPYRWIFSTGAEISPGSIRGRVERVGGGLATQGQLLVGLYPGNADTIPDPLQTEPLAITQADTSGRYELSGLSVEGKRQWLFGMYDRDGNREIRGQGEFVSAEPGTVTLTLESPEVVIPMRLVDPDAPAVVQGNLARVEGDTVTVWLELFTEDADSLARPTKRIKVGKEGQFSFPQVSPGVYRLTAFCDVNESGQRDTDEEPLVYGRVEVRPSETHELGEWAGPRCIP